MSIDRRNQIIVVYSPEDEYAGKVVCAALVRSFSSAQVETAEQIDDCDLFGTAVLINPRDEYAKTVKRFMTDGRKLLLLGKMGSKVGEQLSAPCGW